MLSGEEILGARMGLFADRETLDQAIEYAQLLCGPEVIVAIGVYHNTLIRILAERAFKEEHNRAT